MKHYNGRKRNVADAYATHLASVNWRLFRQQVLVRDKERCVLCNGLERLEIHHRTYERLGKEDISDCYTLCHRCHEVVTDMQRRERYANHSLPKLADVQRSTPDSLPIQGQSIYETRTVVQDYQRSTPDYAFWVTRQSSESLCQSNEENQLETRQD